MLPIMQLGKMSSLTSAQLRKIKLRESCQGDVLRFIGFIYRGKVRI
jgi:hypothetical protein